MSTKKLILAAVLTVLGLMGQASADPADPQASEPSPRTSPAIVPGEPNEAQPGSSAGVLGVILLTDGQVVQGTAVQDDTGYLIKTPFGSKRFPSGRIEKTFQTLREAYEYKASQFPDEDTDERLKLAQWCLAQNLQEEAKAQLRGIIKINPKHPPAQAMLEKIEQAEVTKAKRRFDPSIQRAQATSEIMTDAAGPKELDPAALAQPNAKPLALTPTDVPDIFNLPRPKALRLMEQFNQTIHPVLQNACAKCHNERYPGNFQLRQVRNRRELNRDTLKLNLEATLQLIDPSTPAKSEILSSSLRPHGYGKTKRPIFKSDDPSYRKIANWVDSVCKPLNTDGIRQASVQSGVAEGEERFAADRVLDLGVGTPSASITGPTRRNIRNKQPASSPHGIDRQAQMPGSTDSGPDDFPSVDMSDVNSMRAAITGRSTPGLPKLPKDSTQNAAAAPARSQTREDTLQLPELPRELNPATPTKKKSKSPPVKLDPALLEGVLRARNSGN